MIAALPITTESPGGGGSTISPPNQTLRLGMPHLAFSGLSESWLLMECGHRHWMLLAAAFKIRTETLIDSDGDRLYPSFVGYRVSGTLASFQEGDDVEILSATYPVSKSRFLSTHRLTASDGRLLDVEMLSILVKRERVGRNCNLVRSDTAAAYKDPIDRLLPECALLVDHRTIRTRRWTTFRGFSCAASDYGSKVYSVRPTPATEFNGAQLLYFARYHEFVDRAEWESGIIDRPSLATSEREVFFFANMDAGDGILVQFVSVEKSSQDRLAHHCRLFRASDKRLMAECFTWKSEPKM
jgi:probable biosynthetic protein (TIGR04099 family)